MWFKYGLKAQKLQKQHALKGPKTPEAARPEGPKNSRSSTP